MICQGCGIPIAPESRRGPKRKWCSERCRKDQYRVPCLDCGAPCNPIANSTGQHCLACGLRRSADAARARAQPQRELVEQMWAEGVPARQIAAAIGASSHPWSLIAKMRARGYDLPVRNAGASKANKGSTFGRKAA